MKLNNKGFAISSVLYALLILAVSLMFGILAILVSRKMTLDNIKKNVKNDINGETLNIPQEYKGVPTGNYQKGQGVSYAGLGWEVVKDNGNNILVVLNDKLSVSSINFASYQNELNNWLKSNSVLATAIKNNYILSMNFSNGSQSFTGYVRVLSLSDIYTGSVPTNLSINNSIINNCSYCSADYNYNLLNVSGSNVYQVRYDATSMLNYLMTNNQAGYVRPVITIKEY